MVICEFHRNSTTDSNFEIVYESDLHHSSFFYNQWSNFLRALLFRSILYFYLFLYFFRMGSGYTCVRHVFGWLNLIIWVRIDTYKILWNLFFRQLWWLKSKCTISVFQIRSYSNFRIVWYFWRNFLQTMFSMSFMNHLRCDFIPLIFDDQKNAWWCNWSTNQGHAVIYGTVKVLSRFHICSDSNILQYSS